MMKKPTRIFPLAMLAAALVLAFALIVSLCDQLGEYRETAELNSRRAFSALVESVNGIDTDLSKTVYCSGSAVLIPLTTDICRRAEAAKTALAVLPTSDTALEHTSVFLSQVGDYSLALARTVSGGGCISEEELANLRALNTTAAQVAAELTELYDSADSFGFFDGTQEDVKNTAPTFLGGMTAMEDGLQDSPTLIYDGPYSDHISQAVPQYLRDGGEPVDEREARAIAAQYLGIPEGNVRLIARSADPVVYTVGTEDTVVSVTEIGGHVIGFTQSVIPGESEIDCEAAEKAAGAFLLARGYTQMEATYHYDMGGVCYLNFVWCGNGVRVYPDLVQVGVALDSGKVTYLQASGYWNNHREERTLTASVREAQARKAVPTSLTITGSPALCIIPSPGKQEILCYEYAAEGENGKRYLCYINAATGVQEDLLMLVEDGNGVLTV